MRKILLTLLVAGLLAASNDATAQTANRQARKDAAEGLKLLKQGSFEAALAKLEAAYAAEPKALTLRGMADAQAGANRPIDAVRSYEKLLEAHAADLKAKDRDAVALALTQAREKTGTLKLAASEADATIAIDGRSLTPAELSQPVRLLPGKHEITAFKLDFEPFAASVEVEATKEASLDVRLQPEKKTGHVRVTAGKGTPPAARVMVDGADAGPAPWEGDLPPGSHAFEVSGPGLIAAKQTVELAAKGDLTLSLETRPAPPPPPAPVTAMAGAPGPVATASPSPAAVTTRVSAAGATGARPAFRAGLVLGLISLPRPAQVELSAKLGDTLGFGAQYSMLPELTPPGSESSLTLKAYQGIVRWFPFSGSFYLGTGLGYQQFKASLGSTVEGGSLVVTADMSSFFVAPQLGWLWVWDSGFALGLNIGVQIPVPKDPVVTSTYGGQPVPNQPGATASQEVVDSARDSEDTVRTLAKFIVKYPIPNLDLLKIGFFF